MMKSAVNTFYFCAVQGLLLIVDHVTRHVEVLHSHKALS
jgi:hypothetical protein